MIAIVAHHYVVNSGLWSVLQSEPLSIKSAFFYLFGMWGKTGINCFVLITGYFMCKSKITWRKFLKLVFEVEFYHIILFSIFYTLGYNRPSLKDFIFIFFPIGSVSDGFVSCFIIFYLFIPFLTILVKGMSRRLHIRLIALCLFVYTFLGMIPIINVTYNYVTWFCVLFLIASYIRYYIVLDNKNYSWGRYFLFSIIISMTGVICVIFLKKNYQMPLPSYWLVSDSNALMAVVTAICGFMYFKNLKLPQSKIINTIASSIFGVLLIHANSDTMRQWLWKDTLNVVGQYFDHYAIINAFLSVVIVFAICVIIDLNRIYFFEKPLFRLIDRRLEK